MMNLEQHIVDVISSFLGDGKLAQILIYLDEKPWIAGERHEIGDVVIELPWIADITFVDLEPAVNWGHSCCYFAVKQDSDEVIKFDARMPPFLKSGSAFRCIWRGHLVPNWVAANKSD
jgi:hypothetical protein